VILEVVNKKKTNEKVNVLRSKIVAKSFAVNSFTPENVQIMLCKYFSEKEEDCTEVVY